MADERASLRKPAALPRRPVVALKAQPVAAAARSPMPAARSLQQRLGNHGTHAFAAHIVATSATAKAAPASAPSATSLTISQPGDLHEREADRVADMVMRMPASPPPEVPEISSACATGASVRRACAACEGKLEEERVHRKEATALTPQMAPAIEANVRALQSEGSPLPQATRDFFEPRFGADFSQVRVHTGGRADSTAKAISAKAFTVGSDIVFAGGQYSPESHEGQHLLAHELTHVVQQDVGTSRLNRQAHSINPGIVTRTNAPKIQRFDLPWGYETDFSWEGVKTAATVVKDAAVEAVDWIVDEIKSLVNAGLDWLREEWNKLERLATALWNAAKQELTNVLQFFTSPLGSLVDAVMNLDADALSRAWSTFSGIVQSVANGFKAIVDNLLGGVNKVWGVINGFATGLLNKLAGITSNFLFKKLPDALQSRAVGFINTLKGLWKTIDDGFTRLIGQIQAWVDYAIDIVFGFLHKVVGFGIDVVIKGIVQFAQLVLFIKDLFTNPMKYVELLAQRSVKAFDGVESRFAGVVGQYFGGGTRTPAPAATTAVKSSAATTTVQRAPDPKAAAEPKTSATWSDIGHGIWKVMGQKWDQFKANPMAVVIGLLRDLVFPLAGHIEDIIKLFKDIYHIVTGPLSAGSLDELWTSLLRILDIPILIYHTIVSILMRQLMVPLIVASFIPHPLVKGIAAAVGYGLLGAFVEAELLNIGHKLLLLRTGKTTGDEKKEAYNRVADSLIALAMTAAIILLMLLLHFLINVAKGIYSFVKGKVFGIEPAPVEAKGSGSAEGRSKGGPEEGKGDGKGDGKGGEAKAGEGTPSKDGKRRIRINEEGKCEVCASPCDQLRKKYGSLVTPDVEARIKAIEDSPKLDNAAKEEALKPIEQELADALKAKAASVKGPYSHLPDDIKVEPGRPFQRGQKPKILAENARQHGGKLMSDEPLDPWYGKELEPPLKGKQEPGKFAEVPDNQAQIDHIIPEKGPNGEPLGSNSYSNAKVVSAEYNRTKSNKL